MLDVEVVFALPERQELIVLTVREGASVGEVIDASGIRACFPGVSLDELEVGIWGRVVDRASCVKAGDRVEIYRALELDPKEARRRLAAAGLTMKDTRG